MTDLVKALRILGVSPSDDAQTIRKAWRALVRTYRPDTARRDPLTASKKLADINLAFEAVCAADSGALAELQAEIEERAKQKERNRHDAMMLQARARRKREKLFAEARARDAVNAHLAREQEQPLLARNGGRDMCSAQLIDRAEKGFVDAMGICSLLNFANARSSYV
ncbi:MAG: J domain-containing protein [Pseudomonadota bacterium]